MKEVQENVENTQILRMKTSHRSPLQQEDVRKPPVDWWSSSRDTYCPSNLVPDSWPTEALRCRAVRKTSKTAVQDIFTFRV